MSRLPNIADNQTSHCYQCGSSLLQLIPCTAGHTDLQVHSHIPKQGEPHYDVVCPDCQHEWYVPRKEGR